MEAVVIEEPSVDELYKMVVRYCGLEDKIPPVQIVSAVQESSDDNPVFRFIDPYEKVGEE